MGPGFNEKFCAQQKKNNLQQKKKKKGKTSRKIRQK